MSGMDYSELRGRMEQLWLTHKEVAARIGVSESQLERKLAGEFVFRQDDIDKLVGLLGIDTRDIGRYFFHPES